MASPLGDYLHKARKRVGLSLREAAQLSGISHGYLVKLELAQKENPSAETLLRLADVLEVDGNKLLAFIGVKPVSVLPAPRTYFRRKYGLSNAEAAELAQIIKKYTNNKGRTHHDTTRGETDTA